MVRNLFLLSFFCVNIFALSSFELASNILNDNTKVSKLKLLFNNQNFKDDKDNLNIALIIKILRQNSLFDTTLNAPNVIRLNFKARTDPIIFFKILNDALNDCGYVYFIPTDLILRDKNIDFSIEVNSQYILDPASFYNKLKSNNVFIKNIKRTGKYNYEYILDFDKARLRPNINLALNFPKLFEKPLKDYILLSKNATNLIVEANDLDAWHPKILFLDKNLNLIKSIQDIEKKNDLSQLIPKECVYIIISDMFSLDNIKRGLKIHLKK